MKVERGRHRIVLRDGLGVVLLVLSVGAVMTLGGGALIRWGYNIASRSDPTMPTIGALAVGSGVIVIGVATAAFGLAMLALSQLTTTVVDLGRREVSLDYRSLFRRSGRIIPFAAIRDVEVESVEGEDGAQSWRVRLVLAGGETVPLTNVLSQRRFPCEKLADELRRATALGGPRDTSIG